MIGWLAGAALLAALLLAAAARAVTNRRPARIDAPEAAMRDAERALTGFRPLSAVVAEDGAAALVFGCGSRIAVLQARRRRVTAREIDWRAVRSTPGGIVVEASGRARAVPLAGVDALHVRQLVGAE